MDRIMLQALTEAVGMGDRSAEEIFEQCWPHYYPGRLTAAEAIRYLAPGYPRDLARRLFLTLANLEMLRYFVEYQGMRQAQYDEMREHLQTLAEVEVRFHAQRLPRPWPAQEQNGTCGLSWGKGIAHPAARQDKGDPPHDAAVPENGQEDGDRTYLEALLDKGVEMLEDQAVSCAASYQAGATAEEATRHISPSYTRDVVRRRLLDLMNLQRMELLVIPAGFTEAQFEEICEHLLGMEEIYARYRACEEGYSI